VCFEGKAGGAHARVHTRAMETYVVRLWTPVDMVEENVRLVVVLLWEVMLLRKAGVLKVVVADLNAARGVVTLAAAELEKSARERRMEADIICGGCWGRQG